MSIWGVIAAKLPEDRGRDFIASLDNAFLRKQLMRSYHFEAIDVFLILSPRHKQEEFYAFLSNQDLRDLISHNTWQNLLSLKNIFYSIRLVNFIGSFSLFHEKNRTKISISQAIAECLSLHNEKPEIKENILFCILCVYKTELTLRENEYNPTLFGSSLPFDLEWGVSKSDKLAAVSDLFKVFSNTQSLCKTFSTHEKALSQGRLGDIYSLLKSIEKYEVESNENLSFKKNTGY